MTHRFTLRIGNHLKSPEKKRYFNQQVFHEVAPRYDLITRVLSLWRDSSWKRTLIASLPSVPTPLCLDLACGTGDIAFLLARRYADASITGLDITGAMLEQARRRNHYAHVRFIQQDMSTLPFPDESFDMVTGGYALRNAPDLSVAMAEIRRVLKTNGIGAFLDFSKPAGSLAQRIEYGLLKTWTGFWGLLLHRNPDVYGYIAESLRLYPDRDQLRQMFALNGLTVVTSRLHFFGVIEALVVRKTA